MRKPEHINEMLKAPTLKSYLNDISGQAIFKIRQKIKEEDRRKTLISCFVLVKNSSSKSEGAALDDVLKLFEDVNDGEEDIQREGIINRLYVFLGREYFPQGKAYGFQRELAKIKTKYFPDSAHRQAQVGYFREGLGNSLGSI
jgi:hypothetical protein